MTIPQPLSDEPLRVGFVPGVTLTKWRRIWAERFKTPLQVVEVTEADQTAALDAGDVDMCFVRLPIDADGLHVIKLYDEVSVAWLAKDHALADLDEVSDADLADETVSTGFSPDEIERAVYEDVVLRVPQSVARTYSRRDMVYRPITDAATTTIALAWRVDASHDAIDDFIGVVRGRTPNSSRTAQAKASGAKASESKASGKGARTKASESKGAVKNPKPGASADRRRANQRRRGR